MYIICMMFADYAHTHSYGGGDWSNTKLVTPPHDDHYIKLGTYGDLTTKLVTVTSMACPVDCSGRWDEWTPWKLSRIYSRVKMSVKEEK